MKISTILRHAADNNLSPGTRDIYEYQGPSYVQTHDFCSCLAVSLAQRDLTGDRPLYKKAKPYSFLVDLGLPTCGLPFTEFEDCAEQQQGARFLWLDFAALVAEDEGL
jgi:hypothetical protein